MNDSVATKSQFTLHWRRRSSCGCSPVRLVCWWSTAKGSRRPARCVGQPDATCW